MHACRFLSLFARAAGLGPRVVPSVGSTYHVVSLGRGMVSPPPPIPVAPMVQPGSATHTVRLFASPTQHGILALPRKQNLVYNM